MPLRFDCVLPVVTVSPIWNCHFHKPGSVCVTVNSTPLRFICSSPTRRNVAGQPIPQEENRGGGEKRIATLLLVDDDEMALELAQIQLIDTNCLQYRVLVDGLEALARLRDTEIDLDDRFHETGLDEASIHGTGIMFVDSSFGKS